jgi:hypothetical protein
MTDSPWSTFKLTTDASDGGKFTSFGDKPATSMQIVNAPQALDVRRVGATDYLTIATGASIPFDCIGNTNEVEVRPADHLSVSVSVRGFWQNGNFLQQV